MEIGNKAELSVLGIPVHFRYSDKPHHDFDIALKIVQLNGIFSITCIRDINNVVTTIPLDSMNAIVKLASDTLGYIPGNLYLQILED